MNRLSWLLQLSLALFIGFAPIHGAQAANDKAFLWRITQPESTVYLFGSIHLADRSFYPLRANILEAFDQADHLVVEINLNANNAITIQEWIGEHGRYPQGQSIKQDLSPETYQQLSDYLSKQGMNLEAYENQKPGLLVTAITSLKMMQLGLSPAYGLDFFFLQRAENQKKNVLQLETFEQQLLMLIDMPNPDLLVQQTLSQLTSIEDFMDELIRAWKLGNEQKMNELMIEDEFEAHPEFAPIFDRLFTQRNIAMSKKIQGYLKKPGSYFVVVGAGHLVGKDSIIDLLEQQGHKAERL